VVATAAEGGMADSLDEANAAFRAWERLLSRERT
jgi:hypothetical protein